MNNLKEIKFFCKYFHPHTIMYEPMPKKALDERIQWEQNNCKLEAKS